MTGPLDSLLARLVSIRKALQQGPLLCCVRVFVLIAGFLAFAASGGGSSTRALAQATGGEGKAMALRPNVVKITATLGQGAVPQTGFGFIVGQQANQLVVITADHVVRGDDPGAEDKAPLITFFENQGSQIRGKLETVELPRDRGDLAVILVQKPGFVTFVTEAIDATPAARGLPVWLVGRAGDWNIPITPGAVAQIDSFTNEIQVEGLAAQVGSSGGPLISSNGIVGMIVRDNDLYTEATPIEPIQKQVGEKWHYAWQLVPAKLSPERPPAEAAERERQRAEAERQQQRAELAEREQRAYSSARGNLSALRTYVTTCTVCAFEADAHAEIAALEPPAPRRSVLCGRTVDYIVDDTGVAEPYRSFLGVWTGAVWNSGICGSLIVERVENDGTAKIQYIYGPMPGKQFPWRAQRHTGAIGYGRLTFQDEEGGNFIFRLKDQNILDAHFTSAQGGTLETVLTREPSSVR